MVFWRFIDPCFVRICLHLGEPCHKFCTVIRLRVQKQILVGWSIVYNLITDRIDFARANTRYPFVDVIPFEGFHISLTDIARVGYRLYAVAIRWPYNIEKYNKLISIGIYLGKSKPLLICIIWTCKCCNEL